MTDQKWIARFAAVLLLATLTPLSLAAQKQPAADPADQNLVFVLVGNAAAIREDVKKYGAVTEMKITDKSFSSLPKR